MAIAAERTLRRRVFEIVEGVDRHSVWPRVFATGLVALIIVNVVAAVFETVPSALVRYGWLFVAIETVSLVVFGAEYVVRLWVSVEHPRARGLSPFRARLRYALTPAAIIDLIAVLPFFVSVFAPHVTLRVIVLLRLLRLFKLGRYSTGFQSLFEAARRERQALLASFLVLLSAVLFAATLAYMAERAVQPDVFGTIPDAVWWALETVTTVGYGDVVPKTAAGRIIGGLTMVTGILMIALPIAIIGSSFAEVIRQRSFVVTFGLVARLPLFSSLDSTVLSDVLPRLRAESVDAGTAIVEPGEGEDDFFVIADGIVELDYPTGRRRLSVGDAFGASPDLAAAPRSYPALALTRVKLLAIDRIDLAHLVERYPELADRLRPDAVTAEQKASPA